MNWVKIHLYHLGSSLKNHAVFRASKWNKNLENIIKRPIYNEDYQQIGIVKDIFGPIKSPFISIKTKPDRKIGSTTNYYVKMN